MAAKASRTPARSNTVTDATPDTPAPDQPADSSGNSGSSGGNDGNDGDDSGTRPGARRPKDSEFFELPPDLKKLPPGGLPATVSSGKPESKPAESKPGGDAKKGCGGVLLFAAGAAAAAAALLLAAL